MKIIVHCENIFLLKLMMKVNWTDCQGQVITKNLKVLNDNRQFVILLSCFLSTIMDLSAFSLSFFSLHWLPLDTSFLTCKETILHLYYCLIIFYQLQLDNCGLSIIMTKKA